MNTHKVIWQEGMLLRPQHFQHNDRYYDHQLKTRTQLTGRLCLGVPHAGDRPAVPQHGQTGDQPGLGHSARTAACSSWVATRRTAGPGRTAQHGQHASLPGAAAGHRQPHRSRADRSNPMCWRVTPPTTPKSPTPTPATTRPARSAVVVPISDCCSASSRATRRTSR